MATNSDTICMELQRIKDIATKENHAEALRLLDGLLRLDPQEHKTWAVRAFVNEHQGDKAAAINDWSQAILFCEEPHYFYMRGINLFQLGRYKEAILDFSKVITLCDLYNSDYYRGPAYFFRADAHLRLGEFEKARLDCANVRDDMQTWTDKLRTKADILAECTQA
jgi:tetratricopeptide (TPR) repeat protein